MSDDLGKKIQQIAEMLGQDTVPDNVKELVALLANSMRSKEPASETAAAPAAEVPEKADDIKEASSESNRPAENNELMKVARKALESVNTVNDPRINLLHAIKPFMNSKRQKKIGNCIQLLQVASLSRLLNEQEHNQHNNAR
ncbi:MAG: hypothetical protein Q8924_16445 [Bacillota bacterium]|nr:hypothetical protein [Bacillota bacterium]